MNGCIGCTQCDPIFESAPSAVVQCTTLYSDPAPPGSFLFHHQDFSFSHLLLKLPTDAIPYLPGPWVHGKLEPSGKAAQQCLEAVECPACAQKGP